MYVGGDGDSDSDHDDVMVMMTFYWHVIVIWSGVQSTRAVLHLAATAASAVRWEILSLSLLSYHIRTIWYHLVSSPESRSDKYYSCVVNLSLAPVTPN